MKVNELTYIAFFITLIVVCAWISIPTLVPFTLQTLGIFVTTGLLGGRRGFIAVLTYILLGAIGLPVFSGFAGGIGILFSNVGGYIIGFLALALVMWGVTKVLGKSTPSLMISMLLGLVACYAFGTAWFMFLYTKSTGPVSLSAVLSWCVIPFIIPDLAKAGIAILLIKRLKPHIKLN